MSHPEANQIKHLSRLQKLLDIGIALTAEEDYNKLLEMILLSAKELTNADGGTLYTITSDNKLHFEIVRRDSRMLQGKGKLEWGGPEVSAQSELSDIPIYDEKGNPNETKVSVYAYTRQSTVNIEDVYKTDLFDFSGPREYDAKTGYHSQSLLTVPLKNRKQEITGILQLVNAIDSATGQVVPFTKDDQRLVEYFASIAATAMTNQRLVHDLQGMFDALEKVLNIGVALSAERDHDRLLEMILINAKELTNADGGTLYTITRDKKLHFEIVRTDSLKLQWGGSSKSKKEEGRGSFPDIPLYDDEGKPNDRMIAVYAVTHDCTVNVPDAYDTETFDFSGTRQFDMKTGYRSKSFLTVPLQNHEQETIGVLQLLNARDKKTGHVIPFSKEDQHLVEAFASEAAIAMTNERLIQELRVLFESLINVLADAIDEKSPITGRHCRRVPIISDMIARAVNDTHEGSLKDVRFSESELYELNIAALLHDCGKIVTPVHVVEKSKKLETISDRISLLNARSEILRRDSIIRSFQEKLRILKRDDPELFEKHKDAFLEIEQKEKEECRQLKEDNEFLKVCNKGMEAMPGDWQNRLLALASKTWEDAEERAQPFMSDDELKNLLISKGTLTKEEREIIQNHVVMTIRMLKEIPYPKYLRDVPEIAGKHHERIDGRGYPLGLTGDQMSIRARILAIADVFEALTAPDRPYKECMPLSTALKILGQMKQEGHIDPELFDVFVNQKVYMKYAQEHLKPDQIDVE